MKTINKLKESKMMTVKRKDKTLLTSIAFVVIMTSGTSVFAKNEIKPYGSLLGFLGFQQSTIYDAGGKAISQSDAIYNISEHSHVGFAFKNGNKYSGKFELTVNEPEKSLSINIREAYGTYKMSQGELTIGQAYSPYVKFSHQYGMYGRSEGYGALYEYPSLQVRYTMNFGLYFSLMKPYLPVKTYEDELGITSPDKIIDPANQEYDLIEVDRELTTGERLENINSLIPKMALGYSFKDGLVSTGIAGNLYAISEENAAVVYNKKWIISYLFYLGSTFKTKKYFINFNSGFALNPANFGVQVMSKGNSLFAPGSAIVLYNIATNRYEIKDTWGAQAYLEAGTEVTEGYELVVGGGYSIVDYPMELAVADSAFEIYLNVKIKLGEDMGIMPSLVYKNYLNDFNDQPEGSEIIIGALTQLGF